MNMVINDIAIDMLPMASGGTNGGAKEFVIDLITSLSKENENVVFNCYCYSFMKEELRDRMTQENIKIHALTRLNRYFWKSYNSKVLFCPFGASSIPTRGLPVLSILYDLQVKAYPQFFSRRDRKNREKQLRDINKKATRIISISHFTREEALKHGFKSEKISVIPINIDYQRKVDRNMINSANREDKNIILYPANLWEHKNHELLFTAFTMALGTGLSPDIRLICTGYGDEQRINYLSSIIKGMKMEKRIILTGYVDSITLNKFYYKSLSVIFPSLYEGFGIPVIEAMSIGVPVCCSNTTALREVSSNAAIRFDPRNPSVIADILCRITSDEDLRNRHKDKGYERASLYRNREKMVTEYSKLINKTYLSSIGT